MPYIRTTTTQKIDCNAEKSLRESFGKAIELIRGKSEEWLMLSFQDSVKMSFRGDATQPMAILEVSIFGKAKNEEYDALTKELCSIVTRELGISGDKIYVKYSEIDHWGYDGFNF